MTSRVISLFRILTRSGQVRPAGTNSWAYVATWRRFFDTKEDEFNDAAEIVDSSVEEVALDNRAEVSVPKHAPIQSETAKRARKEFIMELRRNSSSNSANVISVSSDISGNVGVARDESDIMNRPNLEIPIRAGVQCNIAQ